MNIKEREKSYLSNVQQLKFTKVLHLNSCITLLTFIINQAHKGKIYSVFCLEQRKNFLKRLC